MNVKNVIGRLSIFVVSNVLAVAGVSAMTCEDVFSSRLVTKPEWMAQLAAYQIMRSRNSFPSAGQMRHIVRQLLKPTFDVAVEQRVIRLQSLFPEMAKEMAAGIRLDQDNEYFTHELINYLFRSRDEEAAKQILHEAIMKVKSIKDSSWGVRSAEQLKIESSVWLKTLEAFEIAEASSSFEHGGARRKALRELIMPYVGITAEGRIRFLSLIADRKLTIDEIAKINFDQSNEMFANTLLRAVENGSAPYIKLDRMLSILRQQHTQVLQRVESQEITSWSDWGGSGTL